MAIGDKMYSVEDKIRWIATTANAVVSDLRASPDVSNIVDLLGACKMIDEKYQKLCQKQDKQNDLQAGTTYTNHSLSGTIKISAADWSIISTVLQRLDKKRNEF